MRGIYVDHALGFPFIWCIMIKMTILISIYFWYLVIARIILNIHVCPNWSSIGTVSVQMHMILCVHVLSLGIIEEWIRHTILSFSLFVVLELMHLALIFISELCLLSSSLHRQMSGLYYVTLLLLDSWLLVIQLRQPYVIYVLEILTKLWKSGRRIYRQNMMESPM